MAGSFDGSKSLRVQEFVSMNPPIFTGSNPKENPQEFIDQLHKILRVMHTSVTEAVGLTSFRL